MITRWVVFVQKEKKAPDKTTTTLVVPFEIEQHARQYAKLMGNNALAIKRMKFDFILGEGL